jgi:hypothetical protein
VSSQDIKTVINDRVKLAVDAHVFGNTPSDTGMHLELILKWSENQLGAAQIIQAKEDFYKETGKIFPEDECFNERMSYFIDYFVFQRPINTSDIYRGLTPFHSYLKFKADDAIKQAHHSLYQIRRHSVSQITIEDLINKETFVLKQNSNTSFEGLQKKDLFQGFLYHTQTALVLSKGLIFHHHQIHRLIKNHLKKSQNAGNFQREYFLSRLAKIQLGNIRHAHIKPKYYYEKQLSLPTTQ